MLANFKSQFDFFSLQASKLLHHIFITAMADPDISPDVEGGLQIQFPHTSTRDLYAFLQVGLKTKNHSHPAQWYIINGFSNQGHFMFLNYQLTTLVVSQSGRLHYWFQFFCLFETDNRYGLKVFSLSKSFENFKHYKKRKCLRVKTRSNLWQN